MFFSFLVPSRRKDNPNSNLIRFLDSLEVNTKDRSNLEVVIKFDVDDDIKEVIGKFPQYSFDIKYFLSDSGNGYLDLYHFLNQCFFKVNKKSNIVIPIADDFTVNLSNWDDVVRQSVFSNDLSSGIFVIHRFPPPLDEPLSFIWDSRCHVDEVPMFSRRLMNIIGSFTNSSDVEIFLLEMMLYHLHQDKIFHHLPNELFFRHCCDRDNTGHQRWYTERKVLEDRTKNPLLLEIYAQRANTIHDELKKELKSDQNY